MAGISYAVCTLCGYLKSDGFQWRTETLLASGSVQVTIVMFSCVVYVIFL